MLLDPLRSVLHEPLRAADARALIGLGPELFTDAGAVLSGESTRVSPGIYRVFSSAGVFSAVGGNILTIGRSYRVVFTIDSVTTAGGGLAVDPSGATGISSTGPKQTTLINANAITFNVKRAAAVATDFQVSGVSVRAMQ